MLKTAEMEDSGLIDSVTGKKIKVSTTTRMKYREFFRGQSTPGYDDNKIESLFQLNNRELNEEIAKDFSAGEVVHMFIGRDSDLTSKPKKIVWIEIRKNQVRKRGSFNFFIAKRFGDSINILKITQGYKKPTKPRIIKTNSIKNLFDSNDLGHLISAIHSYGKKSQQTKSTINQTIASVIQLNTILSKKGIRQRLSYLHRILPRWVESV